MVEPYLSLNFHAKVLNAFHTHEPYLFKAERGQNGGLLQ